MEIDFIRQVAPTVVDLPGGKVKLLFTLRAAAEMEAEFQAPYLAVVYEALGLTPEGKPSSPMPLARQARLAAILMRAGGQDVDAEALMQLHMEDFALLAAGMVQEMFLKTPRGDKKKAGAAG